MTYDLVQEEAAPKKKRSVRDLRPVRRKRADIAHLPPGLLTDKGYVVPEGTMRGLLRAQSLRGRIYVVCWTWQKHRVVLAKNEGEFLVRLWKWWYERQGWEIRGSIAWGPKGERHAVALHEYDAKTYERIA